jgi:hypothetical protein
MDNNPKEDLRWNYLFQKIEKLGLLTKEKKQFILGGQKEWTPKDITWHPELVANSLAQDYETLDLIKFFLSHIKIVIAQDNTQAKAYFGICQSFTQKAETKYSNLPLEEAIEAGKKYLLKSQKQGGFYNEFKMFGGIADQWPTAFILLQLLEIDEDIKKSSDFNLAIDILFATKKEKGWGYCQHIEPDADSTFLTISLLKRINHPEWQTLYSEAKNNFVIGDGGLGTYKNSPLKNNDITEWGHSHLCVSAAANCINNDFENYILSELPKAQKLTYWWHSNAYTLYFLTKAKLHLKETKIMQWLEKEMNESAKSTNIFHLSLLALSAMQSNMPKNRIDPFIRRILEHQREEGFWKGDTQLLNMDGSNNYVIDQNNLFTTTMATLALHKFHYEYQ